MRKALFSLFAVALAAAAISAFPHEAKAELTACREAKVQHNGATVRVLFDLADKKRAVKAGETFRTGTDCVIDQIGYSTPTCPKAWVTYTFDVPKGGSLRVINGVQEQRHKLFVKSFPLTPRQTDKAKGGAQLPVILTCGAEPSYPIVSDPDPVPGTVPGRVIDNTGTCGFVRCDDELSAPTTGSTGR